MFKPLRCIAATALMTVVGFHASTLVALSGPSGQDYVVENVADSDKSAFLLGLGLMLLPATRRNN